MMFRSLRRCFSSQVISKPCNEVFFSGIQPTGTLHLGNYLGAVHNWVKMQNDAPTQSEVLYTIVDMHSLTAIDSHKHSMDPALRLSTKCREMAAMLLACGVNPDKCTLFVQSHVPQHAELAWILSCVASYASLQTMIQFKEKSAGKVTDNVSVGLFTYPVLQAADILLYKGTKVPVGEDQRQHIELARRVAKLFNNKYNTEVFPLPEAVFMDKQSQRVMSLRNGTNKMSKSDHSDQSRINMMDDKDLIAFKFKKAKTDALEGITYDPINRPEVSNLIQIFASVNNISIEEALSILQPVCSGANSKVVFKQMLTDAVINRVDPIRSEYLKLMNDQIYIDEILRDGAIKAQNKAKPVMDQVKQIIGFLQ